MAANEIANRDVAGGVLQFDGVATLPAVLQSWGVDPASIERLGVGTYRIRLEQGQSFDFDTGTSAITRYSAVPLVSSVGPLAGGGILGITLSTEAPPVDGVNEAPFLIVTVQDAAGAVTDVGCVCAFSLTEAPER